MTHPPFAVTVDLVLMTVADGRLSVLLQRRAADVFAGMLALPGGFVRIDEPLDAAARRVLADKAGFAAGEAQDAGAWLEQLYTFGDLGRASPRATPGPERRREVSVGYLALTADENQIERQDQLLGHPVAFDIQPRTVMAVFNNETIPTRTWPTKDNHLVIAEFLN